MHMTKKEIRFSYNWNNKLHNKAFISLRLSDKFGEGEEYYILLKGKKGEYESLGKAVIVEIKEITMNKITEFIAYLDSGYCAEECKKVLKRIHKNVNWETQIIKLILFKYEHTDISSDS